MTSARGEPSPVQVLGELLALCPGPSDDLAERCRAVADWPAVFEASERHGVAEILCRAMDGAGVASPKPFAEGRAARRAAETLWAERSALALAEILDAFDSRAIRACCLKGPALAERLFGDLSVRPSADLDILFAPGDLPRVREALESLGCETSEDAAPDSPSAKRRCHWTFRRAGWPRIETHFAPLANFGVRVEAGPFIERSAAFESAVMGRPVPVLSPEDEFVFLAAHAAKHLMEKLLWPYELKLFALAHPDLDWSRACDVAKGAGLSLPVAFAAWFTNEKLNARLPWEDESLGVGRRSRLAMAKTLFDWDSIPKTTAGQIPSRLFYQALLSDRALDGFRHALAHSGRIAGRRASAIASPPGPSRRSPSAPQP